MISRCNLVILDHFNIHLSNYFLLKKRKFKHGFLSRVDTGHFYSRVKYMSSFPIMFCVDHTVYLCHWYVTSILLQYFFLCCACVSYKCLVIKSWILSMNTNWNLLPYFLFCIVPCIITNFISRLHTLLIQGLSQRFISMKQKKNISWIYFL